MRRVSRLHRAGLKLFNGLIANQPQVNNLPHTV